MPSISIPSPFNRPCVAARRGGGPFRALRALLGVVALAVLAAGSALGQQLPGRALESGAVLDLKEPVQAVGISADESMIAAVEGGAPEGWRVSLIDRPSLGRLGYLSAGVGEAPRLRFSPAGDLLLVAGNGALELWTLPIAALKPGKALGEVHRLWRVALKDDHPLGEVRFLAPDHDVVWSVGGALFRKPARPGEGQSAAPETLWTAEDTSRQITGFSADPTGGRVALTFAGQKTVSLLEPGSPVPPRELAGHRFEVTATLFDNRGALVSLDAGRNMIRHPSGEGLGRTLFLKSLPSGFRPGGGRGLGPEHLLLTADGGKGAGLTGRLMTLEGEVLPDIVRANGRHAIQASATGRYLLAARGRSITVFRFAYPTSPLDYVRQLRAWKAYQTAQSYVRLMDDQGLSPRMKSDLLAAVGQEPPGKELNLALKRLREAEQEGNAERIRHWAGRVLNYAPDHPDALGALRRLADLQEAEVMRQAQEAYNLGQNRIAITLLSSQIPEDSRRYPEALELIRKAEARRSVETLLMQAREKLGLGDVVAAEALLNEALRRAPEDEAALALQDEIDDRNGQGPWGFLAAGLAVILLTGVIGFVVARARRVKALRAAGSKETPLENSRRNGKGKGMESRAKAGAGNARMGAAAAGARRGTAAKRGNGRSDSGDIGGSRSTASGPRRAVVEGLIRDIQGRIAAVRKADLHRRFTASLMEWEAELEAIVRNLGDPHAELGGLHRRLRAIAEALKALKIGSSEAGGSRGAKSRSGQTRSAGSGAGGNGEQVSGGDASQPGGAGFRSAPENATYYELLQLGPEASQEEIRTSYHRLLKQYHPDLHHDSRFDWIKSESERMSRRISEAYQVLSDEAAKDRYDRELRKTRKGGA